MIEKHFTHLHLHSEFSLLDGAIKLEKLIQFGKENKFKSLAITDHGNIFGAVKFFQLCKKAGIKPVLGMEAYFTEDIKQKIPDKKYYHIILLVQNKIGYQNLCKLISYSYQDGFYFKPRIDYQLLKEYNEGLIVTSACLGGHIPQLLMNNEEEKAYKQLDWFLNVFNNRFYLEVQPPDQTEQQLLNQKLFAISKERGIPLVATGDCHYLTAQDREAHEIMLCIQTQHKITDSDRFTFGDCRVHIRTEQEMLTLFSDYQDAVWNSGLIADQCEFDFETNKLFFPKFEIPQEHTSESYFELLCKQGLQQLIDNNLIDMQIQEQYWSRLTEEMALIIKMGFVGYFLVVSDFIQWAKKNGIPVGPGRGSAAGSLVAWALQITNIDPLKYNLLFERFLNPERISMPDIDIDFCIEGRDKVINYVRDKYGHNNVGQIITFGTMMAKGVIKDVARVLGIPFEDSNTISSLVPDHLKITLKEAREQEPKLNELINANPTVAKLFDLASRLEGITRHASKHAAGIVISPEPIDQVLPVYVPPKSTELVTQYAMTELESLGFLKMDLLGLKNLTLIDKAVKILAKNHSINLDIYRIALDDPKTFQLLGQGKTSGVFQLESKGIKDVLIKLKPEKFEDIIAVNALYRPGPLGSGMVEDFIQRRHGKQQVTYLFEDLKPILQETYGIIVYQEQVMKIASTIAGYSLGQSDILRKAMGKKKAEVMEQQRELFTKNAIARGYDAKKSGELFDLMAYFAGYGFNKSHSAAYALIAYQTAYLKAHYPAEFMACLISLESSDVQTIAFYLQEAKDMGLTILAPSINQSDIDFTVVDEKILFGLKGIKNVGMASLENILAERQKKSFSDIFDFCTRIDLRISNKRVLENLICAGALDCFAGHRAQKYEELSVILEKASDFKKQQLTGQMNLFGKATQSSSSDISHQFAPLAEWDMKTTLEKEREVTGFFLSAHPLDAYKQYYTLLNCPSFKENLDAALKLNSPQDPLAKGIGLLVETKTIITKKGERMAFITLEDFQSKAEVILFPKVYARVEQWLTQYSVFVVKGTIDLTTTQQCKIKAYQCVPIQLLAQEWEKGGPLQIELPSPLDQKSLQELKAILEPGAISLELIFQENNTNLKLAAKQSINITESLLTYIQQNTLQANFYL